MRDTPVTRRAFLRFAAGAAATAGSIQGVRPVRAAEPKRGGTLRLLQIEPAVGFNPALEGTNWPETQRMVYNGLTDYGPTGELVPGLARSWTISDSADTFTFRLTPGVLFHDGKECTAEDVRFTYETIADAKTASALNVYVANLKAVETPDKHTAILRFNGPNVLMMPGSGGWHPAQAHLGRHRLPEEPGARSLAQVLDDGIRQLA